MKKVFITFGDGSQDFRDASNRLCNQAKSINVFDECYGYKQDYLESFPDFWNKHKDYIENNKKGFGFWIWKAFIILKELEKINDGDIVFYADAGCIIDSSHINNINNAFNTLINDEDFITHICGYDCTEQKYCKKDVLDYFNISSEDFLKSPQIETNVIIFKKSDKIYNFVKNWYEIVISNNYHFADDTPSINKNYDEFVEHRYDQSILSILVKQQKFNLIYAGIINVARYKKG
jgi:hypothetical protein